MYHFSTTQTEYGEHNNDSSTLTQISPYAQQPDRKRRILSTNTTPHNADTTPKHLPPSRPLYHYTHIVALPNLPAVRTIAWCGTAAPAGPPRPLYRTGGRGRRRRAPRGRRLRSWRGHLAAGAPRTGVSAVRPPLPLLPRTITRHCWSLSVNSGLVSAMARPQEEAALCNAVRAVPRFRGNDARGLLKGFW